MTRPTMRMTTEELHELLRAHRPQYGYDFDRTFDAARHAHRDALERVRASVEAPAGPRSYPDAITDPLDPPTVSGTDVSKPV